MTFVLSISSLYILGHEMPVKYATDFPPFPRYENNETRLMLPKYPH